MNASIASAADARETFDRLVAELRPRLHRYCSRMTGSVIDGEDIVQEALANAIESFPDAGTILDAQSWLFRIAHNAALDFVRRRARADAIRSDEDPDLFISPTSAADDRQIAASSLRTFMRLPVAQRSSVILMDVLGYSLEEIGTIMDVSIPAVKAALHRGRVRLRELAQEPEEVPLPVLPEAERSLLARYIESFNARDFDALRDMLAEEVRLELVNRRRMDGRGEVATYFDNYGRLHDWRVVQGFVDGRAALLVRDPGSPSSRPIYFVLLEWANDRVINIRDFRFARYAAEGAELFAFDEPTR